MMKNKQILHGYDNRGVVYDDHDYVIRKIMQPHIAQTKDLLDRHNTFNLKQDGFIDTSILRSSADELLLQHPKHIISYSYEWPASMFKDAVLFHLELFIKLDQYGLTLKDALPNNILFDFYKPVFVDFCSLVKKEQLTEESWLLEIAGKKPSDLRFFIFDKMFIPFFLLPFLLMYEKRYTEARSILFDRACNTGSKAPAWDDLVERSAGRRKLLSSYAHVAQWYVKSLYRWPHNFVSFCQEMYDFVQSCEVRQQHSNYLSYYEIKKENFDVENHATWKDKQIGVYRVINHYKPETVLDLGANTGWFSMLAAKEGARVIATDIDEASVDWLYLHGKQHALKILPLLLPFDRCQAKKFGIINGATLSEDGEQRPLFLPATERLSADVVLCLALIHHLILGQGLMLDNVMQVLAALTKKALVVEFVEIDDELIQQDPSFFACLGRYTKTSYNAELFIKAGCKYFTSYEMLASHPQTRKLIILKK